MASNQLRLWFSAFAHLMLSVLRAEVLRGTELAKATLGQIRLKLFKIAARITAILSTAVLLTNMNGHAVGGFLERCGPIPLRRTLSFPLRLQIDCNFVCMYLFNL